MVDEKLSDRIETVRRFNRFYTRQIGVLQEHLLQSPFSLTEARVLYELAHQERTTAGELAFELSLDRGYLSRILSGLQKHGLVGKTPSEDDGRRSVLELTEEGMRVFARLNEDSRNEIASMLEHLPEADQGHLVNAMTKIQQLLGGKPETKAPYLLRPHQPGDMGWVVYRHGALYSKEYGFDESFEALVATIVAKFIEELDPKRERCWIAEKDGKNVGSVFLVHQSDDVAKLRLLLVEPEARGLGIGARLVEECLRFARRSGYRKITLWTNDILDAARRIYQKAGFRIVAREPHHSFGSDLVGETWELDL